MTSMQTLPQRHLAFISLALGFLVIWTAVLAGVLVSRTLKEQATADEAVKGFHTHEDIGRIAFSLGHELVSTVDWLVSSLPESKESNGVTWNITDGVLAIVKSKRPTLSVLDTFRAKLGKVRGSLHAQSDPLEAVARYSELNELLTKRAFPSGDASDMPYSLFVQGMLQRFGELSLGTVYVKTRISLNKTQFMELRISSESAMESAFQFAAPRSHARWSEMQEPGVRRALATVADDLLEGEVQRGSRQMAATYLEGVKEQIAILLLTKEVLTSSMAASIDRLSGKAKSTFAFHISVAVVALGAILVCMMVTGCTFTSLSRAESKSNPDGNDNFYCTASDKAQILASSNYPRPQCYF